MFILMFALTGLTILVDIAILTVMWLMNVNTLKEVKSTLKELKKENIEIL